MQALSDALYDVMAADATLTALLGTYQGAPSIFTMRPVPEGAGWPVVIAATVVSDVDEDLIASQGREIQRDIAIYGKAPDQYGAVVSAAERIRTLFHRRQAPIVVSGWRKVSIRARGPIDAPAEPKEIGRIVTLVIRLHQT